MADEWWSSAHRPTDDGAASPCSSTAPATDQQLDAAESAAAATMSSTTITSTDFRPALLHADDAAAAPPSFLADPPPHHMDWTAQAYTGGGGRAAAEAAAPVTSFNALLQLHGDAGRHFLLGQQLHVDGAAPILPAAAAEEEASQSASLYAGNQLYSSNSCSYGDVRAPAALMMTMVPFPQQEFSGFFGSSTRNLGDMMPAAAPPMTTTKPLLLQAIEQKAFKSHKEPTHQDAARSSATTTSVPGGSPAPAKKPRLATPSPLPTFKVRKEKLGDRITALQQLVSPFGKTDTASVLHEAIEYIRFLHDQVATLSSPYLRCGRPVQHLQQQKDGGEAKDLRSRGLCLVPLTSTTYAVASETAPEFWPPAFGGTFH